MWCLFGQTLVLVLVQSEWTSFRETDRLPSHVTLDVKSNMLNGLLQEAPVSRQVCERQILKDPSGCLSAGHREALHAR